MLLLYTFISGGEGEIRTHERVAPLPVFKTGAFNRSAISPYSITYINNGCDKLSSISSLNCLQPLATFFAQSSDALLSAESEIYL